jgi:ribosomal protein L37AE/L43A
MLTYNELLELREKLTNGEINLEFAKGQFWSDFKEGRKSWNTNDWKERRLMFLKDKCEICSGNDTLTVQHLSHPRTYAEYLREITREHTDEFINTNSEIGKSEFAKHVHKNHDYVPVPLCPNCKAKNPRVRVRKTPIHCCTVCQHEFDNAIFRSVDELISIFYENEDAYEVQDKCFVSKDKWKNKNNLASVRYWLKRERAKTKDSDQIEKKAFLLHLNDCIKYLSFEDAITACRTCAYNFDIQKMDLCPKCQKHYKGIQYPTCIECLPEERRKVVLENIQFGKEWHEMHKRLGLD